jgi:hypothetical protein
MSNALVGIVAVITLGVGVSIAIFESAPLVTDALTGAALGTFIGAAAAYRRERTAARRGRRMTVRSSWIVFRWSCAVGLFGAGAHLLVAVTMSPMSRTILALGVGLVLCVPLALVGQALDFSGWAWMAGVLVVTVLALLVDREGFYGAEDG